MWERGSTEVREKRNKDITKWKLKYQKERKTERERERFGPERKTNRDVKAKISSGKMNSMIN